MLRVMADFLEVTTALEREAEYDTVFVDTEFTRLPLQKEHIRSWARSTAVSYTHLTLPTICSV